MVIKTFYIMDFSSNDLSDDNCYYVAIRPIWLN
jgi:hypothetical protein